MAFHATRHLLVFLVLLLACGAAAATQPASYPPFEVKSGNRQFMARVFVADRQGAERPWQWRYRLQVVSARDHAVQWESDYVYDGQPGGELSDDGRYFASTSAWFHDSGQLVSIYHAQGQHQFSAADLKVSATGLEGTQAHRIWLEDARFLSDDSGARRFVVDTVQGRRCIGLQRDISVEDPCTGDAPPR